MIDTTEQEMELIKKVIANRLAISMAEARKYLRQNNGALQQLERIEAKKKLLKSKGKWVKPKYVN